MKKVELMIVSCMAVGAAFFAQANEPLSDGALREKIVSFVMLPRRLCGHAVVDFRNELRERKLTNRDWFDGDTNRLARIIAEIAQTNDVEIASMMIGELGKYGTYAQLPVLYSCATNPVVGGRALKSIFAIEGVTSNSVAATRDYLSLTNAFTQQMDYDRSDVCEWLLKEVSTSPNLAYLKSSCLTAAVDYAQNVSIMHKSLDEAICASDPTYQHSKRRLAVMRSAQNRGWNPMLTNYVTNAINELVAYPEANLPD